MVLTIALLAVVNIAFGFGLAIYLQRYGVSPSIQFPKVARRKPAAIVEEPAEMPETTAPTPAPIAPAPKLEQSLEASEPEIESVATKEIEKEPLQEIADAEEIVAEMHKPSGGDEVETVSDDNVLAGIEAFRSQLAKISKSSAAGDPEEELDEELATT